MYCGSLQFVQNLRSNITLMIKTSELWFKADNSYSEFTRNQTIRTLSYGVEPRRNGHLVCLTMWESAIIFRV